MAFALARRYPGAQRHRSGLRRADAGAGPGQGREDGGARRLAAAPTFVAGDVLALPFPDDRFAAVTVAFGVRNVADLPGAFSEMVRVTRPGGRVICLEITTPPPGLGRRFHELWFDRFVPALGRLVAGDGSAYAYLPASVRSFPEAGALAAIMSQCRPASGPLPALRHGHRRAALRRGARHRGEAPHDATPRDLTWRSPAQQRRIAAGMRRVEARLASVAHAYPGQLGAVVGVYARRRRQASAAAARAAVRPTRRTAERRRDPRGGGGRAAAHGHAGPRRRHRRRGAAPRPAYRGQRIRCRRGHVGRQLPVRRRLRGGRGQPATPARSRG